MAFTIGSGTFTNGSATVTGVTLTSGTLAYFASGTRMVVGVNPVVQEVEAIAAPTVTTITLRSAWTGTGGTYSFLANQTSEGLRDAVQAIRSNNASLQSFIDSIDIAATANSVAQRTSDGSINAVNVYASGKIGVGSTSPIGKLDVSDGTNPLSFDSATYNEIQSYNRPLLLNRQGQNVGIGTSSPSERLTVNGSTVLGSETNQTSITRVGGYGLLSGGSRFGSYGQVILNANYTFTGSARRYMMTSGLDASKFAIIRSTDATTDPAIGESGAISSGVADFVINSSGNVGIGTSSPTTKLTLAGVPEITLVRDGIGSSSINHDSIGAYFGTVNSQATRFITNNAERMRIDSSGNVLVGTTSGSSHTFSKNSYQPVVYVKDVNPDNIGSRIGMAIDVGTFDSPDSSSVFISLRRRDSTQVGSIMRSGTDSVSYNTSSDYRLKEDWQPMEGSIDRLMQLKPCNFAWKADGSRVDGFLAHEAQEVVPEAVHGEKDAVRIQQYEVSPAVYEDVVIPAELDEEGNEISPERTEQKLVSEAVMGEREVPEYQGIDQSKIVPLLTAALQDAVKEIEALKARIEALEG